MIIDLRSDTVTKPTKGMLDAMFSAEVGDDVFGEDPTVIALEQKTAKLFDKEAGLFCPSGTMTNQIAIKVHTQPGEEVICDALSHIYNYEGGGIAFNSGCSVKLLNGDSGRFTAEDVAKAINPDDVHYPVTKLVAAENTCNKGGGSIWDWNEIEKISKLCKEKYLMFHLDGARIFNALTSPPYPSPSERGVPTHNSLSPVQQGFPPTGGEDFGGASPSPLGRAGVGLLFSSISVCLSKGLGAPAGSVLLGNKIFIERSRRVRKVFGGGMRQAGYLAAAGIYALDHHIERLKEDHSRAKELEKVLQNLSFVKNVLPVETNIVIFELAENLPVSDFIFTMFSEGIKVVQMGPQKVRMVTHLDFTDIMLGRVIEVLKDINTKQT